MPVSERTRRKLRPQLVLGKASFPTDNKLSDKLPERVCPLDQVGDKEEMSFATLVCDMNSPIKVRHTAADRPTDRSNNTRLITNTQEAP